MTVLPNGSNVIPGEVRFSIDMRDIASEDLAKLEQRIIEAATDIAVQDQVELSWKRVSSAPPSAVDQRLLALQEEIVGDIGIEPLKLPSGAGHDAMQFAQDVPTAMFFVRSRDGISHNPREFSSLQDCAMAAHALSGLLRTLLSRTNHPPVR